METPAHAALAQRFRDEPERARVTVRVATELRRGMLCRTTARGHVVECDEPRSLGGSDAAQSPVELLLTSLATCQAVTYRLWADELGIPLERVDVEVEGDIDLRGFLGVADVPAGYDRMHISVRLTGGDDRHAELAEAVDRHCPVADALARPIPVSRSLEGSAPAA
jgi:uncharacterized OsmC-like protein